MIMTKSDLKRRSKMTQKLRMKEGSQKEHDTKRSKETPQKITEKVHKKSFWSFGLWSF